MPRSTTSCCTRPGAARAAGSRSRWPGALHDDDKAGTGFFDQLRTLRTALPANLPVVELMFVCLSLGMMGPYRTVPDGAKQLARVRHQVFGMIEAGGGEGGARPAEPLSAEVAGVRLPPPPRAGVPVWVAGSAALGIVVAVYVGCLASLNGASDMFYAEALAAPPATMPALVRPPATPPPPPAPEPPPPGPATRLRAALAGLPGVEVIEAPGAAIVRVSAAALFPPTTAVLIRGPLPDRLAQALGAEPGPLRIVGHTDSQTPAQRRLPLEVRPLLGPRHRPPHRPGPQRARPGPPRRRRPGRHRAARPRHHPRGPGTEPPPRDHRRLRPAQPMTPFTA